MGVGWVRWSSSQSSVGGVWVGTIDSSIWVSVSTPSGITVSAISISVVEVSWISISFCVTFGNNVGGGNWGSGEMSSIWITISRISNWGRSKLSCNFDLCWFYCNGFYG